MGLTHSPRIVTTDLGLLLDPANPKSYPGSGTTWYDLSGNNNHATLTNAPTFANGKVTWNGTNQYATLTSNETNLNFKDEQTIIMWVKRTQAGSPLNRENPWDQAYGGYGTITHEVSGSLNYYYGRAGGNAQPYTARGSSSVDFDTLHCMCITRDVSTITWYQNGVGSTPGANGFAAVGSPPGSMGVTTNNIRIALGYAGYWEGEMGPVLAYTRALTAAEVEQNFNAYRGRFGL